MVRGTDVDRLAVFKSSELHLDRFDLLSNLGDVFPHLAVQHPSLVLDASAGQLSAQTESSSQYPGTEHHDQQDVERPNRQRMLSRLHLW